jgi:hypothetical protein
MDLKRSGSYVSLKQQNRDQRIDLVRGLALLIIFIDHNAFLDQKTFGWLTAFTLGRFSFIDAADVFFFISGFVSGLIYTRILCTRGLGACFKKASVRCLQLYAAELILFLSCSALILSAPIVDTSAPWSAFHRLRDLPAETLKATLTLRNPPPFFGLLPIYIFFISLTPIAIWLRIRLPLVLIALSVSSYLVAQTLPSAHAFTYSDGFNPFAWQLVFFGGVFLGAGKNLEHSKTPSISPGLFKAAALGLLLIAFLRVATSPKLASLLHTPVLMNLVPPTFPWTLKQDVEPLRLLNLALWIVVVASIPVTSRIFQNLCARLLLVCGQNSLIVFSASVFLNYVVLIYAKAGSDSKAIQLLWNLAGCGLLIATAMCWGWLTNLPQRGSWTNRRQYDLVPPLHRAAQFLTLLVYLSWQGIRELFDKNFDI